MSDGPYRSLQMSQQWKKACEVAQNAAHEATDLVERVRVAALNDVVKDVGSPTLDAIAKAVGALPGESGFLDPLTELEGLRTDVPPTTLNERLIEHTKGAYEGGHRGTAALEEGLRRAVCEHLEAGQRQVEEHYRRAEGNAVGRDRTRRVREALREASSTSTVRTVVKQAIDRMKGKRGQLRARKRDAVSDGPPAPSQRQELAHA